MKKKEVFYPHCWETSYSWIKKDKNNNCEYCSVCKRSLWIENSGSSQVKSHTSTASHRAKEVLLDRKTNQFVIVSTSSNAIFLFRSTITFSLEKRVLRAQTLQPSNCGYENYSFASASNDNEKFKTMFPDLKIAEKHGIKPYEKYTEWFYESII